MSFGITTVSIVGVLAMSVSSLPAGALPPPGPKPTDPTNAQLQSAADNKNQLATLVGQYNGKVAAAQIQLQQLQGALQLAEQKVALAYSESQAASAAAVTARAKVTQAGQKVAQAHIDFVNAVQDRYYGSGMSGTTGSLLTATDPSGLLEINALQQYQTQSKGDAVGRLQAAEVGKSNADAAARVAEQKAKKAAKAAKTAAAAAKDQYATQQVEKANLESTLTQYQGASTAAESRLVNLQTQRQTFVQWQSAYNAYETYVAEQKRIAVARAQAKARAQRLAAEQAQARARARAQQQSGSHNGNGGGSAPIVSGPPAPSGGSWTAAKGRRAVARARDLLGDLYIFAGGNQYGPTDGGCTDPIAPCGTLGYDCSGLVMYAWGKGWTHFAATQYNEVGSYHPSPGNFMPGDLLFWSENGTVGGIGHVAIYIGNDDVIQAPQSGDVVKITPWQDVESGYFGATRPLT